MKRDDETGLAAANLAGRDSRDQRHHDFLRAALTGLLANGSAGDLENMHHRHRLVRTAYAYAGDMIEFADGSKVQGPKSKVGDHG